MKHLVLGSSGQIGGHLVQYLKDNKEIVYEFDIVKNPYEDLRIEDNLLLEKYITKCDIVHFLAFDVGGAKYLEKHQDTSQFILNNMGIMFNTFKTIWQYNKPVIFASSQMAEMNYSTYGVLKSLGEKITRGMNGLVIKFWNVYGYETNFEKSHVITDFIKMAKHEGTIKMRTDGTESRQFLYADDACEALLHLSKNYHKLPKNKEYCITSFEWSTVNEIADFIDVISSCKVIRGTKKDQTQQNAMNEPDPHIKKYWSPKTSLKDGIIELYKMY